MLLSQFISLLGLALNIAAVYLLYCLIEKSMAFISMDLPSALFFSMPKNDRHNFICIALQDVFVTIKEKIFASSVRSCTVYGPCIPRALSKAVGYPKVFVHNVL